MQACPQVRPWATGSRNTGRLTPVERAQGSEVGPIDRRNGGRPDGDVPMNLILLPRSEGRARHFDLAHPLSVGAVAVLILGILGTGFAIGMRLGERARLDAPRADTSAGASIMAAQPAWQLPMMAGLGESGCSARTRCTNSRSALDTSSSVCPGSGFGWKTTK